MNLHLVIGIIERDEEHIHAYNINYTKRDLPYEVH